MIQLGLTQKVQKAAGIRPANLCEIKDSKNALGNWTVNLFNQDRRKHLIFINHKTLYSFILTGARKEHYKELSKVFYLGVRQLLELDGFSESQIAYLMAGLEEVQCTKTHSKSVLGNLNDLIWQYQLDFSEQGGMEFADVGEVIMRLNRMPQRNLDWSCPVQAVRGIALNG